MSVGTGAAQRLGADPGPRVGLAQAGSTLRLRRPVVVPAVLATLASAIFSLQELGKPSPWRDEAVTLGVSTRSFPQIVHQGAHVDGVLTPYYLALHVLLGSRPDIVIARLPSVIATAITAGLLVVLANRLFGLRAGYVAGALFTLLPMTSRYAQEARPYALTSLLAVVATLFLLRALDGGEARWFAGYTAAVALLGYTNLLAILLLGAHAVTASHVRERFSRWLISAAAAVVAVAPLAWVGSRETIALESLRRPGWAKLASVLSGMSGTWTAFWWLALTSACGLLVLLLRRRGPTDSGPRTAVTSGPPMARPWVARPWVGLSRVALPWLLIPPVLLFAASQVRPLFADRYLVFCLPALVLIVAAALSRPSWPIPVALLVIVALLTWRVQHNIRSEAGHTEDLRNLAHYEISHAQSGDALLYLPARLRVIAGAYPAMASKADDVALARSGAISGTLYGTEIAAPDISSAVAVHQRVWLVTNVQARSTTPTDAAKGPVLAADYHLTWHHVYAGQFVLELYVRTSRR